MRIQAFNYKKWADERTLQAIETIDMNEFPDSYTFVCQQLNHIVIIEELFRSRLTNSPSPHERTNTETIPDFFNLETRLLTSCDWYLNYVSGLKSGDEKIVFTFTDGRKGMMKVDEILFHIINHGSYHRGNIAHSLDLASVPHPIDGYGIYIHEKEPERRKVYAKT